MEEIHDLSSSSRPATPQSASPPAAVQSNEPEGTVVRVHGCFACCCLLCCTFYYCYMRSYIATLGSQLQQTGCCVFLLEQLPSSAVHGYLVVQCMSACSVGTWLPSNVTWVHGCLLCNDVESARLIGVAAGCSPNGIRSDWRRSSIQAGPGS